MLSHCFAYGVFLTYISNPVHLSAVKAGSVLLGANLYKCPLNSITFAISVEALGLALCLPRRSCEVGCVSYQCKLWHHHSSASVSCVNLNAWCTVERMTCTWR